MVKAGRAIHDVAVSGDLVHIVRHNIFKLILTVSGHSRIVIAAEAMHLTVVHSEIHYVRFVRKILPCKAFALVLGGRNAVLVSSMSKRQEQGQGQGQGRG